MKARLTIRHLCEEAKRFAEMESSREEPALFGVDNGKAVGTYFEHKFRSYLREKYEYDQGSSAKGIDFPTLGVDVKVTSITQPQSSCPYASAEQKIFGLGYSLLVFVHEKTDDHQKRASKLNIRHVVFVEAEHTADYQITSRIRQILENNGNEDDLMALMSDYLLPVDEIGKQRIAQRILREGPPALGYLTISNALQWRLQYHRVIEKAGQVEGVHRLR